MSMKIEIPSLGESINEAVLVKWLKPEGARVGRDEPVCELETDKANVELPSPGAGVLHHLKNEGATVKIGEVVATLEEGLAEPKAEEAKKAAPETASMTTPAKAEPLSPAVRSLVEENRLDPAELKGTGPQGRILKEDVLAYLKARASKPEGPPLSPSAGRLEKPDRSDPLTAVAVARNPLAAGTSLARREPMSKIRKKIAERLVAVQHQAAMLTTFNEVDMAAVLELRVRYKERFESTYGVTLGLMSFFARASALALKEFPVVNAFIDGDDIVYHETVNLGIAVSTKRGLIVPVLAQVETMSFSQIELEIKRMAAAARDGKLALAELSGGTFTITNGGVFGSLLSTPILNAPQSAILGMHAIQRRPIAVSGGGEERVEVRPMMYLALSYDHRIIDGKDSVSFLVRLKQLLEDPARLLLEI